VEDEHRPAVVLWRTVTGRVARVGRGRVTCGEGVRFTKRPSGQGSGCGGSESRAVKRVGAGPGAGMPLGLREETSIGPPPADGSYLNCRRPYHRLVGAD
jgi:hypothetical protein